MIRSFRCPTPPERRRLSAEAWTILGTGGALFVGLAVAIWRGLNVRLELMAQQHAAELQVLRGDLRDLRADHGARLDRIDARQFEMAQSLARLGEPVRDPTPRKLVP